MKETLSQKMVNMFITHRNAILNAGFLYELYKIDWKEQHNITSSDERKLATAWRDAHKGSSLSWSPDWHGSALLEFGYGEKGCYACYNEFCTNELMDKEYMNRLIGDDTKLRDLYNAVYSYFNFND